MPSGSGKFAQSIISRRKRHAREVDKAQAAEKSSTSAPLIFESLEPRLLLAADPLGISAGYALNDASSMTTADAPGHGVIDTLVHGAGHLDNGPPLGSINSSQQNAATPQTNQSKVSVTYANAQVAGDINILTISWDNTTSNITSVTDSAGNRYRLAVPAGNGVNQAIYYATNIKEATAGTNTVTVTFSELTPSADIRALEFDGLQLVQHNSTANGDGAGQHDKSAPWGSITGSQRNSTANADGAGQHDKSAPWGSITGSQRNSTANVPIDPIQTEMVTPAAAAAAPAAAPAAAAAAFATPTFVQVNAATPQTNQSTVEVTYANAQVAGDINILTISWDNTTSNITSVTDSAGNRYRLAVPAGNGVNQAIYYATNIKEATAGTNTVTVTFSESTPSADIRALEFDGLQLVQHNSTANGDGAGQHDKSAPWGSITGSQRNSTANADGAGQHDKSAPWGSITGSQRNSTANVPIDPIQTEMVTPAAAAAAPAAAPAAAAAAFATPTFVQVNAATPQTNQSTVAVTYTNAQVAGDTNILAIGWNNTTSNITSVTDSAGNVYQLAVPTARGSGISQAIYYAKNIKAAAAGTNTVTVAFSASTPFVDIRALEYSSLDLVNPFDVGTSASGSGTSANSGTVTTTSPGALIFGAGITTGGFSAAGANFVNRIITTPDLDIAEDRFVTTTGSYGATASLGGSAAWVMQVATFRAAGGTDTVAPTAAITAPTGGATVSGSVTVAATASDNVGVAGVQFLLDNNALGAEDTTAPYSVSWDTTTAANGTHTLVARARDTSGNTALSAPVSVNVANTGVFENEILATGFDLPTAIKFLPDGRMLVVELAGTIKVLPPPYTQADPTPFLTLTNVGSSGDQTVQQQGIYDIALDPNFATNHFYYIFYTAATPNRDRLSRFTANSTLTGTVAGSELILYQDTQDANTEHHGGAINFGNDGKIYFTTGDYFLGTPSQDLTSPGGKILRINPDGTVPTDNPFYDGSGPNYDAIWALGLRNPYRAYYDVPTGRLLIGDVGGNNASTAIEELNVGVRGANYGWPNVEGTSNNPAYTNPIYSYPHNGRDAAITGGFVYHGTQFPSSYQGSYFFADYAQNWIKRLTFDANGNVNGVFNFEPANGAADGPTGDIVYLTEGPEGALYYVDLGVSDTTGTVGVSKIRRISFVGSSDLPPVVSASANPTQGPTPLTVNFSSAGSSDPEGKPLTYSWNFGDNTTSTAANPTHTYNIAGPYQVRLTVSDGVNSTLSTPLNISAGTRPTATILSPTDGVLFKAGDVISFSGSATDVEDGTLPASAYTWTIDFLHEGHVHPGTPITGVTSGAFTIPTTGHDFSGFTRYRISLTVTDSSGLQSTSSVTIFPQKVNLTFDAVPAGATLFLDGIAHTAPFVYDTLIGFNHTIEALNQTIGTNTYTFASWSDGGAQTHTIVVPGAAQTYTANFNVATPALAFVQVNAATPQTNQSTVAVTYTNAQVAGDTNILAIGWNNTTSNITSVTDSAGNVYQLAVPTARGSGISQAIYYAKNIKAAAAGTNTVTVAFSASTPFVDIRALEYSGLDLVNPFDVGTSASGSGTSANSGTVTTTAAGALIFGAGITTGGFSAAGANFVNRIITTPDLDIAEDRFVTTTGSYGATASLGGSAAWVMQVATFRAAGGTDTVAPTAAITAPTGGATVSGSVTVAATASDNVGVAGVQFLLDNNALGAEDTTAPYSVSWNTTTAANGTHTLVARARDVNGNTALSAPVSVNVANTGDTVAPTAAITAPTGGATVSGSVTVAATASDNVGVAGVQFLLDNNALGAEDTTSPYSVSWNTTTAANGTHTLVARARDVNGNTALSAPVTVNVANATSAAPAFVQVNAATPQTNQSTVSVTYTSAQVAGDTNILAIGWNNTTSNITSVTDSAGNTYQLAVPTARGSGISQAIYYANNIKAAAAGTNTVTVTFSASTPFVDIRALEYSGLDPVNPFDVGTSASGTGTSANSGTVTTTAAGALIFGAGITTGGFSAAGANFVNRIITTPDLDIAEDRLVTTTGSYSATASLGGSAAWVMQVATFRAASGSTA